MFSTFVSGEVSGTVAPVKARAGTRELLGSGLLCPPDLRASGWTVLEEDHLNGEVQVAWAPRLAVMIEVSFADAEPARTLPATVEQTLCSFNLRLSPTELVARRIDVAAILPGGVRLPLIGSPFTALRRRRAGTPSRRKAKSCRGEAAVPKSGTGGASTVDIIVPVYGGRQETLDCMESLFRTTKIEQAEIVVVNDASPDAELVNALHAFSAQKKITLLTNEANLGYAGAVNRALSLHPDRDVILLNADTEVFGDWMERLRKTAHGASDVGTVTPLGRGAITDYAGKSTSLSSEAQIVDTLARQANAGKSVELPVGVGFCMYIKRACLSETGELDADTFVLGYGEENDFCLRARKRGWRSVAATDVFVRHHGGLSFGDTAGLLKKRNGRVLNQLYPGYATSVEAFLEADPLLQARRAIDMARLKRSAVRPVLLLTHDLFGGVGRHVEERRRTLESEGHTAIILMPAGGQHGQGKVRLVVRSLDFENLVFAIPGELDLLAGLLRELSCLHVELHHFLRLPPGLLELPQKLGAPYDVYLHDYSWICPRVALIDGTGRYCGEPDVSGCEKCVRRNGSALEESLTVAALRRRSGALLTAAREVLAPTVDTLARFSRYFPEISFTTMPWETPPPAAATKHPAAADGRLRVAVVGAIGKPKGYELLLDCARDAAARELALDFVVIGYTSDDAALQETGRVFVTGPYEEHEVASLLARERCAAALCPSVAPETWCYSLTHASAAGLPIVALKLGAQAERLSGYPAAELLDPSAIGAEVNASLLKILAVAKDQGRAPEDAMDENKLPEPAAPAEQKTTQDLTGRNLLSSVQILRLPQGIYCFRLKEGEVTHEERETLAVPALQVGVAPIRSQGKVEFLTGGSALDRWLAYKADMMVVRIMGGEASVSLTSIHTENTPALAVDVKRLQAEPADSTRAAAPAVPVQGALSMRMLAHIRFVGDLESEGNRAGWPGQQMWIEGFAMSANAGLPGEGLEYRGLVANGFQTPWLRSPTFCGSRGGGLPLVGYAVRLNAEWKKRYQCEYSGTFLSGATVGPLVGGELCSSGAVDDPLESMEVFVREHRPDAAKADWPALTNPVTG
jgi:GT2 family glycosyltransferase/glycosyltransferase involved in cell wall biosynthesis